MFTLTITAEVVAWYGAILATITIIIKIIEFLRTFNNIKVKVERGLKMISTSGDVSPYKNDVAYCSIKIINNSDNSIFTQSAGYILKVGDKRIAQFANSLKIIEIKPKNSYDFFVEQEKVDPDLKNIKYFFVKDRTGKSYKCKRF